MDTINLDQPQGATYAEALELALANLEQAGLALSPEMTALFLSPQFQSMTHEERRLQVLAELAKLDQTNEIRE